MPIMLETFVRRGNRTETSMTLQIHPHRYCRAPYVHLYQDQHGLRGGPEHQASMRIQMVYLCLALVHFLGRALWTPETLFCGKRRRTSRPTGGLEKRYNYAITIFMMLK